MVKSILEQKMALAIYSTEKGIPVLTSTQLDLAEKIVPVISADATSVSVMIPFLRMLTKTLKSNTMMWGLQQ